MSLVISGNKYKYLSGASSFIVLKPKEALFKLLLQDCIQPLILIDDTHDTIKGLCTNDKIATYSTLWYRSLDSYTSNYKIDYYIESYFPEELLDDPYYFQDDTTKWFITSSKKPL